VGDLSDFQRGHTVDARLAGAFVTEKATVFCLSRTAISKVMMAYINHGKTSSSIRIVAENEK
jgi:hypothetical protein